MALQGVRRRALVRRRSLQTVGRVDRVHDLEHLSSALLMAEQPLESEVPDQASVGHPCDAAALWKGGARVVDADVAQDLGALYPGAGAIRRPVPVRPGGAGTFEKGRLCFLRATLYERALPADHPNPATCRGNKAALVREMSTS